MGIMRVTEENKGFYPTPKKLVMKMYDQVKGDFRDANNGGYSWNKNKFPSILEPSAGKGDIIKGIMDILDVDADFLNERVSAIELDPDLQKLLKADGFNLVYDDFLSFNSPERFDIILMNPPFNQGAQHLMKAIKIQEKSGGKIVCLLNAETIKNSYTNLRKELAHKLEELGAEVEYIENAFTDAERTTGVETALIYIDIPQRYNSKILEALDAAEEVEDTDYISEDIETMDFLGSRVTRYLRDAEIGLNAIKEINKVIQVLPKQDYNKLIELKTSSGREFIYNLRLYYWKELLQNEVFIGKLTSNLIGKYQDLILDLKYKDFSLFNIKQIQYDMSLSMLGGIEETILNLFDKFSFQSTYNPEFSKNIHLYNGWKTNKAHYINKKVIQKITLWDHFGYFETYSAVSTLEDIEKVLNYLSLERSDVKSDIKTILKIAEANKNFKDLEFKYFYITFFKKGTAHITFKDQMLLDRFNIYASQKKAWLPPTYGKKKYNEMDQEEKEAIKEFQGQEKYNEVLKNRQVYLIETNNLLAIQ